MFAHIKRRVKTISDPVGSLESVKKRLATLIETAISGNPYFGHVSKEWQEIPRNFAQNLPLATVRIGPIVPEDQVYGMILHSTNIACVEGKFERHSFTVYCFASACKESGEESNRYVHQFTDEIKDYLEEQRFNQNSYNIIDIEDLNMRESNVEDVRNIRRMILEGMLLLKKPQETYYHDAFEYIFLAE